MLIDALRVDYIFNKNNSYYLKSIEKLEEKTCVIFFNRQKKNKFRLVKLKM